MKEGEGEEREERVKLVRGERDEVEAKEGVDAERPMLYTETLAVITMWVTTSTHGKDARGGCGVRREDRVARVGCHRSPAPIRLGSTVA